jgi:hypothetical protein
MELYIVSRSVPQPICLPSLVASLAYPSPYAVLILNWRTGWTEEESETLRKALMLFGIGNWAKIIESDCLPGKTNAQMNLQLQRLLGQQSTAGK